jgi:hypothetical protein
MYAAARSIYLSALISTLDHAQLTMIVTLHKMTYLPSVGHLLTRVTLFSVAI